MSSTPATTRTRPATSPQRTVSLRSKRLNSRSAHGLYCAGDCSIADDTVAAGTSRGLWSRPDYRRPTVHCRTETRPRASTPSLPTRPLCDLRRILAGRSGEGHEGEWLRRSMPRYTACWTLRPCAESPDSARQRRREALSPWVERVRQQTRQHSSNPDLRDWALRCRRSALACTVGDREMLTDRPRPWSPACSIPSCHSA